MRLEAFRAFRSEHISSCEENRELFAEFAKQVTEESGVETAKAHVEVMDAKLENLIYLISLEDIEG